MQVRCPVLLLLSGLFACTGDVDDPGGSFDSKTGPAQFTPYRSASALNPAFGTAHARPRYNPHGAIQTAFIDGANDAYNLGIRTLKIWVGPEIKDPSFYFLPQSDIDRYSDFSSALDFSAFQAVLAIPFQTVVFEADDVTFWTMANTPLTQVDKDRIYQMTYDFTARLLRDFSGSGRTFIIQNHEGDWHIAPPGNDPSNIGLNNFLDYWSIRQQAVEDARSGQSSDVNVYHLCEVVRALPSLQRDAPSLTRDVLPHVACDLVGYSAYESALQSNAAFEQALSYIRSKALASPTFGTNQVVVSEIGLPEQNAAFSTAAKQNMVSLIISLIQRGMPYVLFWTLYDNECHLAACSQQGGITSNVPQETLHGYYVRRPDGSLGYMFSQILEGLTVQSQPTGLTPEQSTGLTPETNATQIHAYIRALYTSVLRREAESGGLAAWAAIYRSGGITCIDMTREFLVSAEALTLQDALPTAGFVEYLYPAAFGRAGDPPGMAYWANQLDSGAISRAQLVQTFAIHLEVATRCQNAGLVP